MAIFSPLRTLLVPVLCFITLPMAIFAGVTTTIAFSVLIFRVIFAYCDFIFAALPKILFGRVSLDQLRLGTGSKYAVHGPVALPELPEHRRTRPRRVSSVSPVSLGTLSPPSPSSPSSQSGLGLIPSVGVERDFEGIGGWRLGDDDEWTTINSRLELPDRQMGRRPRALSVAPAYLAELAHHQLGRRDRSVTPEDRRWSTVAVPYATKMRSQSIAPLAFTRVEEEDPPSTPPHSKKLSL